MQLDTGDVLLHSLDDLDLRFFDYGGWELFWPRNPSARGTECNVVCFQSVGEIPTICMRFVNFSITCFIQKLINPGLCEVLVAICDKIVSFRIVLST